MASIPNKVAEGETLNPEMGFKENSANSGNVEGDFDLSLLKDSLSMTPSERLQANDDALNFVESLREAMKKRNA